MIDRADYCVLVVDDHEPARYATARALRAAGFRTIEAAAGAEALELAEYASAVVLDVHLQVSAIYVTEQDKATAAKPAPTRT